MASVNVLYLGAKNANYLHSLGDWHTMQVQVPDDNDVSSWHYLPEVADETFDAVLVAQDVSAAAHAGSFANWMRVLRCGGQLFLENSSDNHNLLVRGLSLIEPLAETVEAQEATRTTIVRKKTNFFPATHHISAALYAEIAGDILQAQYHYCLARTVAPADWDAAHYLALFYNRQNQFAQAVEVWRQMRRQYPQSTKPLVMEVLNTLITGDYPHGFRMREAYAERFLPYERRSHAYPPPPVRLHPQRWQGENLNGKTLIVWSEFGLGDEIMFASLARWLKQACGVARLLWVVQPPLVELLRSHPDIDEVISADTAAQHCPPVDYWDFPHALLAHCEQPFVALPKRSPYLFADADKARAFDVSAAAGKLKIGLVWRGDPRHENDAMRSLHRPELLDTLLDIPNTAWFNLQKSVNDEEQQWLQSRPITDWRGQLHDFADTAAALSQLDLLVTADTSVVHAAGALGVPALVMLAPVYDWRWGLPQNGVSPWYPSVEKVFAPHPLAGWIGKIGCVREKIVNIVD